MKGMIIFSILFCFLFGNTFKDDELPGIGIFYDGDCIKYTTNPTGKSLLPQDPTKCFADNRAEVLWVDRNHQNAIAEHVSGSGNGMFIQAGWYLNNERTSLYRTLGTNIPQWTFLLPGSSGYIPVDASMTGEDIIVTSPGEPIYSFSHDSPAAQWTYHLPSGFTAAASAQGPSVAMSDNGDIAAALGRAGDQARLFVFNATGDTIITMGFEPNSGVYGLDASDDCSVFCVTTYYAIYIFNLDGTRRDSLYNYGQTVAKISGNGDYLVRGSFSATVYFYHWNGTSYESVWQDNTGHPWVTSVAVSDDGSTVMAGTYQYSPANSGKVLMYDSSSSTPLWEYSQYGDYVASCALSEDGQKGVAGSWGQFGGTYGDVVTVFDRSSSTPILQVLDDTDEPGSIFSVDISKDGSFIMAGGKAVHAREFGNGGEVYSIRILDSLTNDVGIEAINIPGSFLQVGQAITPQVIVKNYGTQTASFNTVCTIYDSLDQMQYSNNFYVNNLPSGAQQTIDFAGPWNVPAYGKYRTVAYTALTGDEFPVNDTLVKTSICYHDGAVSSVVYPFAELTLHYAGAPVASITNNGSYSENIPVSCAIYDQYNTLVYTGSGQSYLNPLQTATITLSPSWTPADTGSHSIYVYTTLNEDYDPSNDTVMTATAITTEIMYDDGILNVYGGVSSNYYDNTFAEKMEPCLGAPYYITSTRFYVSSTDPIIMSLNRDSLGLPGLSPAYYIVAPETLNATGAGWLTRDITPSIEMTDTDPFWFVVQWLSSTPNLPYIGMDNTPPRDSLSYWYWTEPSNPGWHLWAPYDFMMRVSTAVQPGVTEDIARAENKFYMYMPRPNPFLRNTNIRFIVPYPGDLKLDVYDISGRVVRSFSQHVDTPGEFNFLWQAKDNKGTKISSGVYFIKAEFDNTPIIHKIIMISD